MIPIIADEVAAATNYEEFKTSIVEQYGVVLKEGLIGTRRAVLITRPPEPDDSCAMHDECTIMIVTEDLEIVAKSIDRIYDYKHPECPLKITDRPNDKMSMSPTFVEEKLPGIHVILAKHKSTYVLSTENILHAAEQVPGTSKSVNSFVVNYINKMQPTRGLDGLFAQEWFSRFCWVFQISPTCFPTYKLVLLSIVNMETGDELSPSQVDNLAEYFRFGRPRKIEVYNEKQMDVAIEELLRTNKNLTHVILSNNRTERAQLKITAEDKLSTFQPGSRRSILTLTEAAMRGVELQEVANSGLVEVLKENRERLIEEVNELYNKNKHRRTRKEFAEHIKKSPFAKVLFGLRSNKIRTVEEFYKIIRPIEFIKTTVKLDYDRLSEAVTKYKENANASTES